MIKRCLLHVLLTPLSFCLLLPATTATADSLRAGDTAVEASDASGAVTVVWAGKDKKTLMASSRPPWGSWQPAVSLFRDDRRVSPIAMTADLYRRTFAIWRSSNRLLLAWRAPNGTWSPPEIVAPINPAIPAGIPDQAAIGALADGSLVAVWCDQLGSGPTGSITEYGGTSAIYTATRSPQGGWMTPFRLAQRRAKECGDNAPSPRVGTNGLLAGAIWVDGDPTFDSDTPPPLTVNGSIRRADGSWSSVAELDGLGRLSEGQLVRPAVAWGADARLHVIGGHQSGGLRLATMAPDGEVSPAEPVPESAHGGRAANVELTMDGVGTLVAVWIVDHTQTWSRPYLTTAMTASQARDRPWSRAEPLDIAQAPTPPGMSGIYNRKALSRDATGNLAFSWTSAFPRACDVGCQSQFARPIFTSVRRSGSTWGARVLTAASQDGNAPRLMPTASFLSLSPLLFSDGPNIVATSVSAASAATKPTITVPRQTARQAVARSAALAKCRSALVGYCTVYAFPDRATARVIGAHRLHCFASAGSERIRRPGDVVTVRLGILAHSSNCPQVIRRLRARGRDLVFKLRVTNDAPGRAAGSTTGRLRLSR